MKHPLRFSRLAVFSVALALSAPISRADAQTVADAPASVLVVPSNNGLRLKVWAKEANVTEILSEIAMRGHLQMVTRGEIVGDVNLNMTGAPEDVLQALCKDALLSCRKVGGVWIVEEIKPGASKPNLPPEKLLDVSFRDMPARELVELINQNFGTNTQVSPDVTAKIAVIHLFHLSPRQAIEQIAFAADLELVEKDNQLFLTPKKSAAQ